MRNVERKRCEALRCAMRQSPWYAPAAAIIARADSLMWEWYRLRLNERGFWCKGEI